MNASEVVLETHVSGSIVTIVRYAPFQKIVPHAHDEEGLTIVLRGTFLEETQRRTVAAEAGSVATRPQALRHTNRFGRDGAVILAVIPDGGRFDEPIREWGWADNPAAFRAALRLIARDEDALSDLLGALGPPPRPDRALVAHARRLLDDVEARLSVSALAKVMDVHPVHLARQFRQAYGLSPRDYRTLQMVKRATTAILGTTAPLTQIAHDCGFADHSHMCRSFRRVAGWSPSRLRAS